MRQIIPPERWILLMACAVLVCCAVTPKSAFGADNPQTYDHDEAREARRRGEILPLEVVLSRIRRSLVGEVVGVSLERHGGRWIYEFRLVGTAGSRLAVHVDARTARVITEGVD